MNADVFAAVLWTTIVIGWIGFLIILLALTREAYRALVSDRARRTNEGPQ